MHAASLLSWDSPNPLRTTRSADGTTIIFYSKEALEKHVLPKYFKHDRFRSLTRQLNSYTFLKVFCPSGLIKFQHPCFVLGQPDLLSKIIRRDFRKEQRREEVAKAMATAEAAEASGFNLYRAAHMVQASQMTRMAHGGGGGHYEEDRWRGESRGAGVSGGPGDGGSEGFKDAADEAGGGAVCSESRRDLRGAQYVRVEEDDEQDDDDEEKDEEDNGGGGGGDDDDDDDELESENGIASELVPEEGSRRKSPTRDSGAAVAPGAWCSLDHRRGPGGYGLVHTTVSPRASASDRATGAKATGSKTAVAAAGASTGAVAPWSVPTVLMASKGVQADKGVVSGAGCALHTVTVTAAKPRPPRKASGASVLLTPRAPFEAGAEMEGAVATKKNTLSHPHKRLVYLFLPSPSSCS